MPREPLRLTRSTLATYRPGALVAIALGGSVSLLQRPPRPHGPHAVRHVAQVAGPMSSGPLPPAERSAVAVVQIRGVLEQRSDGWDCGWTDGYDRITERLAAALADLAVGSVVLDIDSPGGDCPGLEQAITRMRAAVVASEKPVVAYVNELCASAAYWLACGVADSIYLPPSGRVGSIGSAIYFVSDARAQAENGVDVTIVRDPAGKMNPNSDEPLDDLGRARLDRRVIDCTARFVAAVASRRGIPAEQVRALNADVLEGAAAIAAGLADGLGSLEETIALAASLATLEAA